MVREQKLAFDRRKVVYQIYPRSYEDTAGNGVGDLHGATEKLPYLEELGVNIVWLNPFYPSPQRDNGYDISGYTATNPLFGTMADFEGLSQEAKEHDIELMLNMVLSRCSIEHEWFQRALAGDKYYQDFFILRNTPTNWISKFDGNAWAPFGDTDKYYLHLFDITQADLSWRNPHAREELFRVVNFWREKGVKGFRFNVVNLIGKDEELKDNTTFGGEPGYTGRLIAHDCLRMLNQAISGQDDNNITVGEMSFADIPNYIQYSNPDDHELDMVLNFHHPKADYENGQKWMLKSLDFEKLRTLFHTWGGEISEGGGWSALLWSNHDQPRTISRLIDVKNFRNGRVIMLTAAIHLSRDTPYIYTGGGIGMFDPDYDSMADYVDVECLNAYQELLTSGKTEAEAFTIIQAKSCDNNHTPTQWDASEDTGFSTDIPWLKVDKTYRDINVENKKSEPIFTFYQQLIRLRRDLPIITEGSYQSAYQDNPYIYAFERHFDGEQLLVLNSFFAKEVGLGLSEAYQSGQILLSNYPKVSLSEKITLKPYQTLAIYQEDL